jgi:hypothetical protein
MSMDLPPNDNGPYRVLAESGDVSVYRCDRGCLHLQFGSMNLRLDDDEFQELAAVIGEAALRTAATRPAQRYGRVQ